MDAAAARPEDPAGLRALVGERTVPDLWHENYWFRRHEAAYRCVAALVPALDAADVVVDAGCGAGYGLALLRDAGRARLLALDYDPGAIRYTARTYPEAATVRANLARLPLVSGSVGVVVCLQVIEHLWTPWEFVAECRRVLRPGGLLVLSTPNRLTFSPGLARGERPANPFHVREYDVDELSQAVGGRLPVQALFGLGHGPRLAAWQAAHGSLTSAQLAGPPETWPTDVADTVRSVTADDFELRPAVDPTGAGAARWWPLDLALLARKPAG